MSLVAFHARAVEDGAGRGGAGLSTALAGHADVLAGHSARTDRDEVVDSMRSAHSDCTWRKLACIGSHSGNQVEAAGAAWLVAVCLDLS